MNKTTAKTWINAALCVLFLSPLYWTFITAIKTKEEIYATPPALIPKSFFLGNFEKIFTVLDGVYKSYLFNSVLITAATVALVVTISMLTGYGFSKLKIKGKGIMLSCILGAIMIPFQALLNPLYLIMSRLGLLNSIPSMMLIYATFQTPFCTYMMKNTFDALPSPLRESAMLDGASEWSIFLKIHAPLTLPSIATIAVYSAYSTWNDYLIALVFANSAKIKTFNVGLINLAVGQYGTDWGLLTAGAFVGLIPILTLFIFMQKYFVKGIMGGAIK